MLIYDRFEKNINKILNESFRENFIVALSGGADSLALTHLSNTFAKKKNIQMIAVTVDHKLRDNSTEEANQVHNLMNKFKISHKILTFKGIPPSSNVEQIAREYRYKLLIDFAKQHKINYIFVAHNKDEQEETFLLNLIRGSGLYGLAGMNDITLKNGINIIRPMLNFTKTEIKEYLLNNDINWIEDPSNQDEKYKRVKIRKLKKLFEDLGLNSERLSNTIQNLQRVKRMCEDYVNEFIDKNVNTLTPDEKTLIPFDKFILLNKEIALRVLAKIIKEKSNKNYPPRFKSLQLLYKKILDKSLLHTITLQHLKIKLDNQNNICFTCEDS